MNKKLVSSSILAAGAVVCLCQINAHAGSGADVAVCFMGTTQYYGRIGDIHGFSIQTVSWNNGDQTLQWQQNSNLHPVIGQNLYRYHDGRLEQIGMSWLKHGFCALQQTGCGPCNPVGGCPQFLLPGCRDPYSASLNGQQSGLGPRSDVNASTGVFPYPYTIAFGASGNQIYKRLQVHDDDLNPAMNEGAVYYIEGQYVHQQEGTTHLRNNNATYERVNVTPVGSTGYSLGSGFNTVQLLPAIYAWQDNDPQVVVEKIDVASTPVDGRFNIAYRVTDNGDGTWRYEYALHNQNSHRSAQAFTVPLGSGVEVSDIYYHDVPYHSGELYSNADWTSSVTEGSSGEITWAGVPYDTNPNANALRWGTMYNFAFTANAPPTMGSIEITLFRPGTPSSVTHPALVPDVVETPGCAEDLNDDGQIDVFDMLQLLGAWGPCKGCDEDLNADSEVNVFDMLSLLGAWGVCEG